MTELFEQHPLAAQLIPQMTPVDLHDLINDIKEKGQRHAIRSFEGKILIGWSRYIACIAGEIEPRIVEYTGDDPIGLIASEDLHRRHMLPADRKKVAQAVIEAHPEKSDRTVAKEAGISPTTVAAIRSGIEPEAASNVQNGHKDSSEADSNLQNANKDRIVELGPEDPAEEDFFVSPAAPPPQRFETGFTKSGEPRKARGRKPGSGKKVDAATVPKEVKPKRLVNARDDWIMKGSEIFKSDTAQTLTDITFMVHSATGPIIQRCSERQRKECADRFVRALGLEFDNLRMIRQLPF